MQVRAGGKLCGVVEYVAGELFYQVDCGGADASDITVSKIGWLSFCELVVHGRSHVALLQLLFSLQMTKSLRNFGFISLLDHMYFTMVYRL